MSTSSPGSSSATMAKNRIGLAPGVTTTFAASHAIPRRARHCAAMVRRNSGSPGAGP
jgi:hypothetical protein